jgi:rfaE bifunctional protein kinase chain/domain
MVEDPMPQTFLKAIEMSESVRKDLANSVLKKLDQLSGKKVLIVGDVGLDQYVIGDVKRISPEAPVPVLEVSTEDQRLGLAANVAQNVTSLGGEPLLLGVVGDDSAAGQLRDELKKAQISDRFLLVDGSRPTTRKLRVMAEHHHIVRVDFEHRRFLSASVQTQLKQSFDRLIEEADGLVIEDYAKGVLDEELLQYMIKKAKEKGKKVLVDPHRTTPVQFYQGADLMTPNRDEAFALSRLDIDDLREKADSYIEVGHELIRQIGSEQMIITRGKQGMSLFSENEVFSFPTFARQVFDVTGAGDTAIAALALSWVSGLNLKEACVLANYAAGVVVGKVGCVPCDKEELKNYIQLHL